MREERISYLTHLECSETGERHAHDRLHGLSRAGNPLLVRYDLAAIARAVTKSELCRRPADMWRYREFLPVADAANVVSLGEAMTPLVPLADVDGDAVLVKGEGRLPTGSFKARGMAVAVSMAKAFGRTRIAVPTAGNAGAAAAAYGARARMETYVFTPADTPEVTVQAIACHGTSVCRVDGLINRCGEIVRAGTERMGWHDLSTLAEPYRIEGKKTMGLELAEQLGWELPDAIYYPTGGCTGFIGMWKAFAELEAVGWIGQRRPRMVAVQTTGCCPIVKAWKSGLDHVPEPWSPVETEVHGVRVPKPLGDKLILRVIRESGGFATAVTDAAVREARAELARRTGIHFCPEGAACYAAWRADRDSGRIDRSARVVLFNTVSGLITPLPAVQTTLLGAGRVDYEAL